LIKSLYKYKGYTARQFIAEFPDDNDECVMFKCVQIMCAKYYELRYMCQSWARSLDTASKFALLSVSGLKNKKSIKKANLHEN